MNSEPDIAVIGSGFAGSLFAMICRRLGFSVVLLEKGSHPRFAIGESTSPLSNLILEELSDRYHIPEIRPLSTYGTWKKTHAHLRCGSKRGFSFFAHTPGKRFADDASHQNQLLVAASPNADLGDMHWHRSDVDQFYMTLACQYGVTYFDNADVTSIESRQNGRERLTFARDGDDTVIDARFIIDASGTRGCLSKLLRIPEEKFKNYPNTRTVFSHFSGVQPCASLSDYKSVTSAPYPVDDAAVHHVFPGGWMWVLKISDTITSAGFSLLPGTFPEIEVGMGPESWAALLAKFPSIAEQFAHANNIMPFMQSSHLPYRTNNAVGDRWALLPSAAAFVDPLFSTGIPLTLLGIERLAKTLEAGLDAASLPAQLKDYEYNILADADQVAFFIRACFASFENFAQFRSLSMFYFASASYTEMCRRLNAPVTQRGFLARENTAFNEVMERCCRTVIDDPCANIEQQVIAGVETLNVAGLAHQAKNHWYDVDLQDVVAGSHKLGLSEATVRRVIGTAAWAGNG